MKGSLAIVNIKDTLKKVESGELTSQEALQLLYPDKPSKPAKYGKRAMFIKMRIHVPEEGKGVNTFLRILFALPFPIIFARLGVRFASRFIDDSEMQDQMKEISKMLKYSKHTKIQVDSDDAQVNIQVI